MKNTNMKVKETEKNRVLFTEDYSVFKINEHAKIFNKKIEEMIISMEVKNLSKDMPILVDENYNVIDGKYRFLANKQLGNPIYFKVSQVTNYLDALTANELNSKPTLMDYLLAHKDKLAYRKALEYKSKLPYPVHDIINYGFTDEVPGTGNGRWFKVRSIRSKGFQQFIRGGMVFNKTTEFRLNRIENFVDKIYKSFDLIEKDFIDVISHLETYSFNIDYAFEKYKEIPFCSEIIEWYLSGHPDAVTPFNFPVWLWQVEDDFEGTVQNLFDKVITDKEKYMRMYYEDFRIINNFSMHHNGNYLE